MSSKIFWKISIFDFSIFDFVVDFSLKIQWKIFKNDLQQKVLGGRTTDWYSTLVCFVSLSSPEAVPKLKFPPHSLQNLPVASRESSYRTAAREPPLAARDHSRPRASREITPDGQPSVSRAGGG